MSAPYLTTERLPKYEYIQAHSLRDSATVRRLARRTMEERALKGFSYEFTLNGHHAPSGALWVPDTTVRIKDQRHDLEDVFYIRRVERRFDQERGRTTVLSVWPNKVWLFDDGTTPDDDYASESMHKIWW